MTVVHSTLDADHAWTLTTWAAAVPLGKRTRYMLQQTVSGVVAFTVSGSETPRAGGECYVRLIADGTNAPIFDEDMLESGASMGYDNREGIVNQIKFWYDGNDVWYAVLQAANPVSVFGPTAVRMAAGTFTESGDGTAGWNYAFAGVAVAENPSLTLASSADGSFRATIGGTLTGNGGVIGWHTAATGASWNTPALGGFVNGGTGKYAPYNVGLPTANGDGNITAVVGDVVRTRRSGTTVYFEVSQGGGAYTVVHTYTGATTAKLYPIITSSDGTDRFNNLRGNGLT
jgi:hypothetical protein